MCGAVLEAGKTPVAPRVPAPRTPAPQTEAGSRSEVPLALRIAANPARSSASSDRQATTSGPSLLGLGDSGPSLDTLREKTFSGTTPTFLYEDAKPGRGRTLLLAVILAILAVGVWARYHYLGFGGGNAKPQATVAPAALGGTSSGTSVATSSGTPTEPAAPAPQQSSDASQTPPAQAAPPQNAAPPPKADSTTQTNDAAKTRESTPKEPAPKRQVAEATAPPKAAAKVKPASAPSGNAKAGADDLGSAAFRKGELYLYGRGVSENCDEAIKNLKSASNSGNAKARSAFGTMYATGHCVPRDLPTSYSWFARALQADPNNQILEKDLTAVWNQMTPPERQLATKIKQ
jgi:hypothetical protein